MATTLTNNLAKGKFATPSDHDLISKQKKNQKLQPLKQRIKDAEKDEFWNDFHNNIKEKSNKVMKPGDPGS